MSETDASREVLSPFCVGMGLDIGFGGSAVVPSAITFDMHRPYTNVGGDTQILRGDATNLSFVCDESLDYIYSSHILEDWTYPELVAILKEWRSKIKPGGLLVTNCPDQQKFLAHVARVQEEHSIDVNNLAHKEQDFSLQTFIDRVLSNTGEWEAVYTEPEFGTYSWLLVVRKVGL